MVCLNCYFNSFPTCHDIITCYIDIQYINTLHRRREITNTAWIAREITKTAWIAKEKTNTAWIAREIINTTVKMP